jgi:autotransporter-associated beta strand protein
VDASADDDGGASSTVKKGVLIGTSSKPALTQVDVGFSAHLQGQSVNLSAIVSNLDGEAVSTAKSGGGITGAGAVSRVEDNDLAYVLVRAGSSVRGTAGLSVQSQYQKLVTKSQADGTAIDLLGSANAFSANHQYTTAQIDTQAGATLTTHSLGVSAEVSVGGSSIFLTQPTTGGFGINLGGSAIDAVQVPQRQINFNSDVVVLTGPAPELRIDEAGFIDRVTGGVTTTFPTGTIAVGPITNSSPGTVRFTTNTAGSTPGVISGSLSTFTFRETFESVTLINRSTRNLEVGSIDPVNRTATATVTISVQQDSNFQFQTIHDFGPTIIDIEDQSVVAAPNVLLDATIDNPAGQIIVHTPGSILDNTGSALLRANSLDLLAGTGSIGGLSTPLHVELVQDPGQPTNLTATAGKDVNLDVKGRLRDPNVSAFTVNTGTIQAGNNISLIVREGTRETATTTLGYTVTVSEPIIPKTTITTRFFPPGYAGSGTTAPPFPFAVFGSNPQTSDVTYNFGLLQATHGISVFRAGLSAAVGVRGNTDIVLGGALNVTTSGDVNLSEVNGNLQLGTVTSTAGSVTLSAQGSIPEPVGGGTAVSGTNVTLNAQTGGIGSAASPLKISSGPLGVVTATAAQGIFLTEAAGALNVQRVESAGGDVVLAVPDAASAGQDLNVVAGGDVKAGGVVTLEAGDNLLLDTGSFLSGTAVSLRGEYLNQDRLGSTLTLRGVVSGAVAQVVGGPANDTFNFVGWSSKATVDGGGGSDSVALSLTGGSVTTLQKLSLAGDVLTNRTVSSAVVNGSLDLGSLTHVFNVAGDLVLPNLVVTASLSGSGGLTKTGAGTLVLSGANGYTGATTVSQGTLQIDGSQAGSPVSLGGGTLAGKGTVGAVGGASGTVAPGDNGPGTLTSVGGVTLAPGDVYRVELNGLVPGLGYDTLNVIGSVNLNGAVLQPSLGLGFASAVGDSFTIVANDGTDPVVGTFAGLPEGTFFTIGTLKFQITYKGGDGNDVVLTHVDSSAMFTNRSVTTPINEGGVVVLSGRPVDPDPLDSFTLVVNWGDGSPTETHVFAPHTLYVQLTHRYLDSSPTPYPISLRWFDQHGQGNSGNLSVVVNNVPPALTLSGPGGAALGQATTFRLDALDPSPIDQSAGFLYRIDWGDGTVSTVSGPTGTLATHTYAQPGTYHVTATATDKDGGVSRVATRTVSILAGNVWGVPGGSTAASAQNQRRQAGPVAGGAQAEPNLPALDALLAEWGGAADVLLALEGDQRLGQGRGGVLGR